MALIFMYQHPKTGLSDETIVRGNTAAAMTGDKLNIESGTLPRTDRCYRKGSDDCSGIKPLLRWCNRDDF